MADVVTRFKLETTQFDSKLRDASKSLADISREAVKAGKGFEGFSKESVEAARALGNTETSAAKTKDKLKELVASFNDAAKAYNSLTKEQKQSDFGKAMADSLDKLKVKISDTKNELEDLGAKSNTFGKAFDSIAGKFGMSASTFTAAGAAVAGVGVAMKLVGDNIATAMNFEKSVSQLSSLTGMMGDELEQLKEYAIDLGGSTTLSASQVADAFKMIGSQQPQLLKSGEALRDVTAAAITLSEAAGIELATAAQTLSTSINQFGGDSDNAARFVNVLAAASQKGAGDISFLGESISKSGVLANAVGVSYEELVANLEMLAKAGIDASTSGTALRSIIANLEKQSNDEYKPSVVGLTEAFHNLNEAHLTTVDYVELAGKQFFSQAMVLAENSDEARRLTDEITGTSTAEEQAKINTNNLDGSIKSLGSAWEALNLHLNSSNGILKTLVDWLKECVVWADKALQSLQNYINYKPDSGAGLDEYDENGNLIGRWNRQTHQRDPVGSSTTTSTPPPQPTPPPRPTIPVGGGGGGRRGGRVGGGRVGTGRGTGRGTGTHKETPAERAKKMVEQALANYNKAITEATMRFEYGMDNSDALKKKELAAQERLTNAYADAYNIYNDEKYKTAFEDSATECRNLTDVVKGFREQFEQSTEELMDMSISADPLKNAEKLKGEDMQTYAKRKGINLDTGKGGGKKTPGEWEWGERMAGFLGNLSGGLNQIAGGLEDLGIKIPKGIEKMITIMQGLSAILTGINTVLITIAMTKYIPLFNNGGIVPHAANGYFVGGNHYSSDLTPVMANAGELILNRAAQGNIASQLQGGMGNLNLSATISGEDIQLALNNYGRRTGRGEYVTSKNR